MLNDYVCKNLNIATLFRGISNKIESVTISDSVTSIGDYAFRGFSGLTSITIPESVTDIGRGAFSRCSGLTSITLFEGVEVIYFNAFECCRKLTDIFYHGTKEQWGLISKRQDWNYDTGNYTIHCSDGDIAKN